MHDRKSEIHWRNIELTWIFHNFFKKLQLNTTRNSDWRVSTEMPGNAQNAGF
jgi:hypothetical protein